MTFQQSNVVESVERMHFVTVTTIVNVNRASKGTTLKNAQVCLCYNFSGTFLFIRIKLYTDMQYLAEV